MRRFLRGKALKDRPVPLWKGGRHTRDERILMIALFDPRGLQTIVENIEMLGQLSRFRYDLINVMGSAGGPAIPERVCLSDYDGIYIHCTASYDAAVLAELDRHIPEKIADYQGLKALMKQDEQYRTNRIVEYLSTNRFDVLTTCVSPEHVRRVYPEDVLGDLRIVHALTGYVTESLAGLRHRPTQNRPVDIGYRGSEQPFYFGRLAYEKRSIGDVVEAAAKARGLRTDISSRWEDRFMGRRWFDFLRRCKATLGLESGASVFDYDGKIEEQCNEYLRAHPGASFEEVYAEILEPHDGVTFYNQISPRHFEAAACRTLQILYEGHYSGIFEAGRHYLSLRRDHSNLDEVLDRALDPHEHARLTETAFDDIVANDAYRYDAFVAELDDAMQVAFDAP